MTRNVAARDTKTASMSSLRPCSHHQSISCHRSNSSDRLNRGGTSDMAPIIMSYQDGEREDTQLDDRNVSKYEITQTTKIDGIVSKLQKREMVTTSAELSSSGGPKITGRRHRAPRRFVVTDLPDYEEDFMQTNIVRSSSSISDSVNSTELSCEPSSVDKRKGKTEIKGRFTIIDLSPESPERSSLRHDIPARSVRLLGEPLHRKGEAQKKHCQKKQLERHTSLDELTPSGNRRVADLESIEKARRGDLNVFDQQLGMLQQESSEMRTLLEGVISTNARWIERLANAGKNASIDNGCNLSRSVSDESMSEPVSPVESNAPTLTNDIWEEKYNTLEHTYVKLQTKYDALLLQHERTELKNKMLETRLQQQLKRTESLRSQLDQLTEYTENLIKGSDPAIDYESDLTSIFGEQSSVEVDDPSLSPVAKKSNNYSFQFEEMNGQKRIGARRRHCVDEECMSDTSSEVSHIEDHISDSDMNNMNQANRATISSEECNSYNSLSDVGSNPADQVAANGEETNQVTLDELLLVQADQLSKSLRSEKGMADDKTIEKRPLLTSNPLFMNNQMSHLTPEDNQGSLDSRLWLMKRENSLSSVNYSTVSSTTSLASFGVQVAALHQSGSGIYSAPSMYASQLETPLNQPFSIDKFSSLIGENLYFHNNGQSASKEGAIKSDIMTLEDLHAEPFASLEKTSN